MSRLQKKCLIASSGLHGLLVVVVLFGAAFFTAKDNLDKLPPMEFIDAKIIDGLTKGGGNPNVKPAPPAPNPNPAPQPSVAKTESLPPPKQRAETVKPTKPESAPPKAHKAEVVKEQPKNDQGLEPTPKPTKKKKEIEVDPTKMVVRNDEGAKRRADAAKEKAKQEREEREYAAAQRQAQMANTARLNSALNNLKNNLSSGTSVEQFGPGAEAFVDYAQFVKQKYDEAWIAPGDGSDDSATVQVKVTIARNGKVVSAEIVKRSGNVVLDNSIDRVLKRVQFVAPFPEGAKDAERTFKIDFVLKSKRLLG